MPPGLRLLNLVDYDPVNRPSRRIQLQAELLRIVTLSEVGRLSEAFYVNLGWRQAAVRGINTISHHRS